MRPLCSDSGYPAVWNFGLGGRLDAKIVVRVEDDDGRGVDAWLSLSEDRAAPTVRLGGTDSD